MSLYGRPFVLICVSTFFFYVSFQLILPVVPLYGVSFGAGQPALMAMTTDRVAPEARGVSGDVVGGRGRRVGAGACAGARDITRPRG